MKKLNFLFIISLCVLICSCKKKDSGSDGGQATYTVKMTDAPGPYSAVNVDIRGVEITGNGGKNVLLNVNAGIYNLLDFANGIDTIIASGAIDAGKIEQIRLILGPNNSIVTDSMQTYPLTIPSGQESGLKLQVHQTIEAGAAYIILLDFDANQSIVKEGNGDYKLKPVIRTINTAITGSIKGSITPTGILASVTASNGTTSYSTAVNANGNFIIMGLPPGTYDITITPVVPFNTVTVTGVVVTAGTSNNIGTKNL